MSYPQPGDAWCKAEFDNEVPSGCGNITDDDVGAEPPDGAHPRDNSRQRVVCTDEERLQFCSRERGSEVGPARYDDMCNLQIDQHVG
jgi:hypothetical protein